MDDIVSFNRPTQNLDKRIRDFFGSFANVGWFSVEIGITKVNRLGDFSRCSANIIIKNGTVLNMEDISGVLDVLDNAGIVTPLPAFHGEELVLYTIDENGGWIDAEVADKEEDFLYVTYYSID